MSRARLTLGSYRNEKKIMVSTLEKSLVRETDMPSVIMEVRSRYVLAAVEA